MDELLPARTWPDHVVHMLYSRLTSEEPWREAIEQLRVLLGASNMMLRISQRGTKPKETIFAYGPKVDQEKIKDWEEQYIRDFFPVNPVQGETVLFRWEDMIPKNPMVDQLRNYDSSWTIVHCFAVMHNVEYQLIGSRHQDQQPFSKQDCSLLEMIGTHFSVASRLRQEIIRARITSEFQAEALDRLAIAGVLVDQNMGMVMLNKTAIKITEQQDGVRFANGALHAVDDQDDRIIQKTIRLVLADTSDTPRTYALSLKRKSSRRDLGIVISGRKSVSFVSGKPETNALIFIRDSDSGTELDISLMRQLFSFTRAEANLAVGLAKGLRLEDLEGELNIRHNTARAHLRSMFIKAAVSRQSELVHLLANSVAPLGQDKSGN